MMISRRMLFASPALAAMSHAKPGEWTPIKKIEKHLLIVWNPFLVGRPMIEGLAAQLGEMGFEGPLIPTLDGNAPDIRIFDLDNLPEAESGMIRELVAQALSKGK